MVFLFTGNGDFQPAAVNEPDNRFDRQLIPILYLVWFLYCGRE